MADEIILNIVEEVIAINIDNAEGTGDMLKSAYDSNNDGMVDLAQNSQKLNNQPASYYLSTVGGTITGDLLLTGDLKNTNNNTATGMLGGSTFNSGAYFQLTGSSFVGEPGKASGEIVIGNQADSKFKVVCTDMVSNFTNLLTVNGATGATTVSGNLTAANLNGINTGDQNLLGLLVKTSNLSDLSSVPSARNNLGLGTLATQSGTFNGVSSGTNTGDETQGTIVSKIGYTSENIGNKGLSNGYASLGADSKIPSSQLPALAITDTFVVANQAAMLALSTAETGDIAVRNDLNKTYILRGANPAVLADWTELLTPTDSVLSVNGQTGAVTLTTSNVAEGSNLYFIADRVRSTLLTAFAIGTNAAIAATDTLLTALGKVQAQLNNKEDTITTLPIAKGGTNNSTALTAGSILFSDGTKITQDNAGVYYDATNKRVGLSTVSPTSAFQVRSKPADAGGYTREVNAGALLKSATTNGGSVPSLPETVLALAREGVGGQAYGNFASFNISRWEAVSTNPRTQLDITLAHANLDVEGNNNPILMSMRSNGRIGMGTTTPADLLHVKGTNVTGLRLESTGACIVLDMYNAGARTWSHRTNYNNSGYELLRSTTVNGSPETTVYHVNDSGNMKIGGTEASEKLDVVGNIALSGNIVKGGFTAKQLVFGTQSKLFGNYTFAAGAGFEEIVAMRVTLPIIAGNQKVEVFHKSFLQTAPGDNNQHIFIGSNTTTASANTSYDAAYVGGAKLLENHGGVVFEDINLTTQQYVFFVFWNGTNKSGAFMSSSGSRTSMLVKVYT